LPETSCPEVFMKIHKTSGETLVALCDRDVIGKTYREGELRIKVTERFYRGKLLEVDDCDPFIKEATIANFVGKDSVAKGVDLGLIREENVIRVAGVPHAQMVRAFL
jgi:hypothetical protein